MTIKDDYQNEYQDFYYRENLNWKVKDIAKTYKYENPNWTWDECYAKAKVLYKELKNMNGQSAREQQRFFRMNKPFSFFDTKDSEFSDTYHDWNSQ